MWLLIISRISAVKAWYFASTASPFLYCSEICKGCIAFRKSVRDFKNNEIFRDFYGFFNRRIFAKGIRDFYRMIFVCKFLME